MLGSASPLAVRTVEDSKAICNFELLELNVDLIATSNTYKVSGVRFVSFVGDVRSVRRDVFWLAKFPVPSDGCLVVELGRSNLDSFKHVVSAVLLERVVVRVDLQHGLHLLGRCRGSLFDNGVLDQLVTEVVVGCVEYSFNSRHVRIEAEVP